MEEFLLRIRESIPIYFIFMGMSWGLGWEISRFFLNKMKLPLKNFNILFLGTFLSSWAGSKLLFLITTQNGQSRNLIQSASFWLGGGFVFYGGLFFSLLFVLIYCIVLKRFNLYGLSYCIPALGFSHSLGRIGCFFSGCCFGKICTFPGLICKLGFYRHPVQLYESFLLFCMGLYFAKKLLQMRLKDKNDLRKIFFKTTSLYILFYAFIRFFMEYFRGDEIRGFYFGFSSSQLISMGILIVLIIILFLAGKKIVINLYR
jgi:phosphatidylglycerol:prolipoprotein diacylglycerol transferase